MLINYHFVQVIFRFTWSWKGSIKDLQWNFSQENLLRWCNSDCPKNSSHLRDNYFHFFRCIDYDLSRSFIITKIRHIGMIQVYNYKNPDTKWYKNYRSDFVTRANKVLLQLWVLLEVNHVSKSCCTLLHVLCIIFDLIFHIFTWIASHQMRMVFRTLRMQDFMVTVTYQT